VALCAFTPNNGATRVVPATQHVPGVGELHNADVAHPRQRLLTGAAGTIFVLNGHLWHSGTRNNSSEPRDSLQIIAGRGQYL
jgi:ectoine hydroxylase-related dioxygenase (phytanoyl-CoA dioxygenase family)